MYLGQDSERPGARYSTRLRARGHAIASTLGAPGPRGWPGVLRQVAALTSGVAHPALVGDRSPIMCLALRKGQCQYDGTQPSLSQSSCAARLV